MSRQKNIVMDAIAFLVIYPLLAARKRSLRRRSRRYDS